MPLYWDFGPSKYLLFSENIPSIIYYSHFAVIIISILLVLLIYFKGEKTLPIYLLSLMIIPFVGWVFLYLVFWASNRSDVIMFVWSLQILIEPLTYLIATYLLYVLTRKQDISFSAKIILSAVYLPLIIFSPTKIFLPAFNISDCLST